MILIDPTVTAANAPYAVKQGLSPVASFAITNSGAYTAAQYTVSGVLQASGRTVMSMGQQSGSVAAGGSNTITLRGSPLGNSADVGATSLELVITLVDLTNGVTDQYTLPNAFSVQQGSALNIVSLTLGAS